MSFAFSMSWIRISFLALLLVPVAPAWGQSNVREPHIGYLYPGGGQKGTVFRVTVGGQYLRGPRQILISGKGVHAKVIRYMRPFRNLNGDQRKLLRERLREVAEKRLAETPGLRAVPGRNAANRDAARRLAARRAEREKKRAAKNVKQEKAKKATVKPDNSKPETAKPDTAKQETAKPDAAKRLAARRAEREKKRAEKNATQEKPKPGKAAPGKAAPADAKAAGDPRKGEKKGGKNAKNQGTFEVKLPDHPLLYDLDKKSLRELVHIVATLQGGRGKQQINRQISEWVLIEVTVDADAPCGERELRIGTSSGLTNPMVFEVGVYPEVCELEPNDRRAHPDVRNLPNAANQFGIPRLRALPPIQSIQLPVVLNGQILPGDVDRFRFQAQKGQPLVIETQARKLVPYLADAVPGWFQATVALYDARGREVAFADEYRFDPDPVLFCRIPADGDYELEIRDAIYRGREDFVYRVTVGEKPFITEMFPLGGQAGVKTTATVKGWNLPAVRLPLDTAAGDPLIRTTDCRGPGWFSNQVAYAVGSLPERLEHEANDTLASAEEVAWPVIVNGRIDRPGDVDVFRFQGRQGDRVVAEILGRRLNSPIDSCLRLTDDVGRVLAWNDDHMVKDGHLHKDRLGLMTHHADSYLVVELPRDGTYCVQVTDTQGQGSEAHGYRLRLSPPRPDFALRVTPSSLSMRGGAIVPISVHALRLDGFDGDIDLVVKNARGFKLAGGRIPAGQDRVRMTLRAPARVAGSSVALELVGQAWIHGEMVNHRVVPADDVMQAFLYRHLLPAREFRVAVRPVRWRVPPMDLAGPQPVLVTPGEATRVRITGWRGQAGQDVKLVLQDPPPGITLQDVNITARGLSFRVKAAKDGPAARVLRQPDRGDDPGGQAHPAGQQDRAGAAGLGRRAARDPHQDREAAILVVGPGLGPERRPGRPFSSRTGSLIAGGPKTGHPRAAFRRSGPNEGISDGSGFGS